ncbi:MAG: hypothetical protein GY696_13125 [Gammaproteobacteria bacterium]|nr:hypothetical protein [Gammaproteobacteria bacterium]
MEYWLAVSAGGIPGVNVKYPFSDLLEGRSGKAKSGDVQVNLPFSDIGGLPFLESLAESLLDRDLVKLRGASGLRTGADESEPLSVINLPFASFNLPFTSLTQERQEIPSFAADTFRSARTQEGSSARDARGPGGLGDYSGREKGEAIVSKGNLDTALESSGPQGRSAELPNTLEMPLSVVDFPMSSIRTPLSHFVMPLSRLDASIEGPSQRSGDVVGTPKDPKPVNLKAFSMPLSFLNTPLGFFNSPLSFVNLPFGSSNLPFGHLNLPFAHFNQPLTQLLQSFPPGLGRSSDPSLKSPLDDPGSFVSLYSDPEAEEESLKTSAEGKAAVDGVGQFLRSFNEEPAGDKTTINEFEIANELLSGILSGTGNADGGSGDILGSLGTALGPALRSSGVPAIDLGLFGTPSSLFTTPFSLFNNAFGFTDMPLGFLNLPLSHFNLPLSHMSLPFANLALPLNDIGLPAFQAHPEAGNVALADVPPSLLEVKNPDNPLTSYVNMPLSEMNLPLAVMDMPFTIFDMPFSWMNTPFSNFANPLSQLHLPLEVSGLPFAQLGLPFQQYVNFGA